MRGKRASGTKHARIRKTIYRSKTLVSLLLPLKTFIPNFVAFFVFSGTASSCIFRSSYSETRRNASLHPPFCFCLAYALFTR